MYLFASYVYVRKAVTFDIDLIATEFTYPKHKHTYFVYPPRYDRTSGTNNVGTLVAFT